MGLFGGYAERDDAETRATLLAAIDGGMKHLDGPIEESVGAIKERIGEGKLP